MYNNLTYGDLVTKLGHQARADLLELGTVASSSTEKKYQNFFLVKLYLCTEYSDWSYTNVSFI